MARPAASRLTGAAPRFRVTLDRADGGAPIEEREVASVTLMNDRLVIFDSAGPVFAGEAWNWIEVTRLDYEATVAPAPARPSAAEGSPRRAVRRAKAKEPT